MNITTSSPVQIDTEIARINSEIGSLEGQIERITGRKGYGPADWNKVDILAARISNLAAELAPFEAEFRARGGWTRWYLVEGGHLHFDVSSFRCSRIMSTSHYWLVDYSGRTAEDMIELAGERVCTVCFPQAPAAVQERPSRLFTATEQEKAEAARERALKSAQAAATKAAKAITAPDGGVLVDRRGDKVTTEAAAQALYRDAAAQVINLTSETYTSLFRGKDQSPAEFAARTDEQVARHQEQAARMLAALAAKHDVSLADERAAHHKPVTAKARKDLKESLAGRAQYLRYYAVQDEV